MKPLTVVAQYLPGHVFEKTIAAITTSGLTEDIVIVGPSSVPYELPACRLLDTGPLQSQKTLEAVLGSIRTAYLLILPGMSQVAIEPTTLERMLAAAGSTEAGLVYSDFYDEDGKDRKYHPLNDYQPGSVRDDFDFGSLILYSVSAVRQALGTYGPIPSSVHYAGLYDMRLKVSVDHLVYHLPEPLYSKIETAARDTDETLFAYVDPGNIAVQREMEGVFTDHLKNIGAYLPSERLCDAGEAEGSFPVEASVIIPVRNRVNTVAEAVKSALAQETHVPFNVIVVDNHSTDGTTAVLAELALRHPALHHIVPARTDLGIGGCWNEALYSPSCGRYAVQLDSDDLYSAADTLQRIADMLRQGNLAMVIGSYTIVDVNLNRIPPGLIDHGEWTDGNGHNNALRINGLGAPRAFNTAVMRSIGFLNVSYGEDYAAALRIGREYRIGRIYESLYLCRRWPGNTDASLGIEATNRNNAFKDRVRTQELMARQAINNAVADSEASFK